MISNALAIAEYLALSPDDRAITTLPLHYCYGLSVLHSHLAAGAGIVLTTASVVDPCFATAMRDRGVTNVAGVPHTFELLERAGPEVLAVPTLRLVTQAGGRMAPERVRAWAERTSRWGADLYVMYGQTEATARMAYLPPAHGVDAPAGDRPGRPWRPLRAAAGRRPAAGVGELIYRGPNVMLGYATTDEDLARGGTLDELATGDLARYDERAGVYEIVGRRSRFVKPFGLRIELDAIERALAADGIDAVATGDDDRLVVVAPGDARRRRPRAGRRPDGAASGRRPCRHRDPAAHGGGQGGLPRARRTGGAGAAAALRRRGLREGPRPRRRSAGRHVRVARR